MGSNAMLKPEPAPIVACTISRDLENFDLLIEDMETELGESWGDLTFDDAAAFLKQPDADSLKFVAIAVDDEDESEITKVGQLITTAKAKGIKVILIAEEVSPIALHQLLRLGADDFVPYPLPENELHQAIERLSQTPAVEEVDDVDVPAEMQTKIKATGDRSAVVLPVQGLAGGTGASTLAVNLAWELANLKSDTPPRVCLLDLDLQFGSVATYLDLPRRESVYELLSEATSMDSDSFMQTLLTFNEKLHVLTAPADLLPLDLVGPEEISHIIEMARTNFDYVVIDMPSTFVGWTETVLNEAHVYFATLELDMRSAQNALRTIRGLKSEELPIEKLRFALNRAPKFADLSGKTRVKRMAESLDIKIELLLPEGAKQVPQACDHGLPLSEAAAKNPLRKEIQKLAQSIFDINQTEKTGG